MEIRTLRYFLAVAREESMTEAANVLHVTQPTLSRQIAELEQELGCTLFRRTNRSTTLTEDGMRLRQRAEEILALVEQTESEVGPGAELQGTIRIGAAETQAMASVVEAFRQLQALHPKVNLNLSTGNADTIEEQLERGVVDFAVVLDPFKVDKYDHLELPRKERVGLLVRPDHPLARKDSVHPEDLEGLDLMVSSRTAHETFDLISWSSGVLQEGSCHIVARFDMIGNFQTNKVNMVVGKVGLIQSVSSLHLAEVISKHSLARSLVSKVLLEVNVSGEESKSGFAPAELVENLDGLLALSGIEIEGLMTMAPANDPDAARRTFSGLRELAEDLRQRTSLSLAELSCGMSDDFPIALEEGSTLIRLGRVVFSPDYELK